MTGRDTLRELEQRIRAEGALERCGDILAAFLAGSGYPIFENETTALLLYRGDVDSVRLIGDMTDWTDAVPFERMLGTDIFYYRGTFEPDARLEYILQPAGFPAPIADPLNRCAVHGFVLNSELAMPRYRRHPVFDEYLDGRMGGFELLDEYRLTEGVLPYAHTVHVYLPPDYHTSGRAFPAVYFQDGRDYIEYGIAPRVLDSLIRGGRVEPLIGVFVTPPNLHEPKVPNRTTEYGMNDAYVEFFCHELVSWVDRSFRTQRSRERRLVVGDSYGGLIAAYIAFRRPDVFGMAYSQSGYFSFQRDRFIKEVGTAAMAGARLFVDVGTYERKVGRGFLPDEEGDFLQANRRLKEVLVAGGADVLYREYPEGHTWGNWRAHLHDGLANFFGFERA